MRPRKASSATLPRLLAASICCSSSVRAQTPPQPEFMSYTERRILVVESGLCNVLFTQPSICWETVCPDTIGLQPMDFHLQPNDALTRRPFRCDKSEGTDQSP